MKKQLLFVLLVLFTATQLHAQDIIRKKEKQSRFSTGIQTIMMNSHDVLPGTDMREFGIGFWGRYFLGKRLAINGQVNITTSERTYGAYYYGRIERNGFEAPLMLEYHLCPGNRIRPFFGLGFGVGSYRTTYLPADAPAFTVYEQYPFLQVSQGVTFDIGKRFQITQSVFYRYRPAENYGTIGLSIGIGLKR